MTEKPLLEFTGVSKTYISGESQLSILQQIDFSLPSGVSVAITGKSGSGKSTFLNIAGGLDKPTSGDVNFLGKALRHMHDKELSEFRNRHIGFIFQSHILLDDFSALENVCIPSLIRGEPKKNVSRRAAQLLERVGLSDRMDHRPNKLSGGERQRVAFCRALVNSPELLIADEPTGSLDEQSSRGIEELLFDLVREQGKTLLLVTHDMQLARKCAVVYLLHNRELQELT
ncbi:ABC transporter ATP-binding protein [Pleomorphochaeta sp. DL1XJH-081]|jgi:predicted ABC-type transport system involved in lysophospholipase L1 biosynthesis ATPase subunit|uniref:ABC transporter ATP-binding protein n=1 Tax=Pleomorphochaeta sp. DL1XJH-081 TaxID=3409690 RepID=UPI003BB494A4